MSDKIAKVTIKIPIHHVSYVIKTTINTISADFGVLSGMVADCSSAEDIDMIRKKMKVLDECLDSCYSVLIDLESIRTNKGE